MTDSLQAVVAELRSLADESSGCLASTKCRMAADRIERLDAEIADLRAKLAACEKDAERYRWLRSTAHTECAQDSLEDLAWFALHNESPDELDLAIDAAIAARSGAEESQTGNGEKAA